MSELLKVEDLIKNYSMGRNEFKALKGISFAVEEGDFVLLYGDSGSGKSTALNIIGGMDRATSGKVLVYNQDITQYNDKQLNEYRRSYIGFVFQSYNLINNLSARENILLVNGNNSAVADKLLAEMGLSNRGDAFPSELSGGEAQRVALARAMAKSPALLLCDEPTGALDYDNSRKVMQTIQRLNRESGVSVLMVTHNTAFLPVANKVIKLKSGWIESITENDNPVDVEQLNW
ncbi:MAG: ABC transporter ATP-binding protein [Clostridiales bacterium]|nr:ABC transporter ATP-binding protein [Clostridiales bacterium]